VSLCHYTLFWVSIKCPVDTRKSPVETKKRPRGRECTRRTSFRVYYTRCVGVLYTRKLESTQEKRALQKSPVDTQKSPVDTQRDLISVITLESTTFDYTQVYDYPRV